MFGGGGGATWPSETKGGPGGKTPEKSFEIFNPEIAAHIYGELIYYYFSLHLSIIIWGGGGGGGSAGP